MVGIYCEIAVHLVTHHTTWEVSLPGSSSLCHAVKTATNLEKNFTLLSFTSQMIWTTWEESSTRGLEGPWSFTESQTEMPFVTPTAQRRCCFSPTYSWFHLCRAKGHWLVIWYASQRKIWEEKEQDQTGEEWDRSQGLNCTLGLLLSHNLNPEPPSSCL